MGILKTIFHNKKYAIVCGGSGLYIQALCNGFDPLPVANEELRKELAELFEKHGIVALQEKLFKIDPVVYKQIDILNPRRLMRSIEVCLMSGASHSDLRNQKHTEKNFGILKIGFEMERKELYERINERVDKMMDAGLLKEAEKMYPFRNLNALQTVGYSELFRFLDGVCTLNEAIEKIKQHSRNYAKRQMTWFRKDQEIKWFQPSENPDVIEYIKTMTDA